MSRSIRLLDEVLDLGSRGAALLCMQEDDAPALAPGVRLRDARGNVHTVATVSRGDGVTTLHIPGGDVAYLERLFRDVRVDATLFTFVEDDA